MNQLCQYEHILKTNSAGTTAYAYFCPDTESLLFIKKITIYNLVITFK